MARKLVPGLLAVALPILTVVASLPAPSPRSLGALTLLILGVWAVWLSTRRR